MSCERYASAIDDHACGAGIAPDARQHLETCGACRARFDRQQRAMQALDAELQQALAIEPSAQFERAVLARIERTAPARPRAIWWTALAAAAVVVIAIGFAVMRSRGNANVVPNVDVARTAPPTPRTPAIVPPTSPPGPIPIDVGPTPERMDVRGPRPRLHPGSSKLPEVDVIVAAEQRAAISRYLSLVKDGAFDNANVVLPPQTEGEPAALVVEPLTVEPLVPDVDGPGGRGDGRE